MPVSLMPLSRITLDPAFSGRVERPSAEVVREYAEAMADAEVPPVVCFSLDGQAVLVDGWIRLLAAIWG